MANFRMAACPKCSKEQRTKIESDAETLKQSYGTIQPEEFVKLYNESQQQASAIPETLREECEIGIKNGVFYASYVGLCTVCGFKYDFESVDDQLKLDDETVKE